MVLPPSTAEELEVVLATKRRLGVSEDPQKGMAFGARSIAHVLKCLV